MERKLAPLHQKWMDDVRAWDASKKQKEDAAFNRCTTPGERANCDLGRFIDYYFMTNGEPDQTKTPEPFAMYGFSGRAELHHMAEKVPGLHTISGGTDGNRTLCIGWNRLAVSHLAMAVSNQAHEEEKKKQEAEWKEAMEEHQDYVSNLGQGGSPQRKTTQTGKGKPSRCFELRRCIGSYIVKCDTVSDGWSSTGGFTMDIREGKGGTLMADYDFGMIQGTMLLSQSEETLDALAGTGDDSDDCSDDASNSEDEDDDDSDDEEKRARRKRRLAKDVTASKKYAAPSSKRRKVTPSLARRVYYRLRGRETGEGEIIHEQEPGHLDFLNGNCATFVGLAYHFPYVGKNVEFRGYKVSDVPKRRAEEWDNFSFGAYEFARRNRWR